MDLIFLKKDLNHLFNKIEIFSPFRGDSGILTYQVRANNQLYSFEYDDNGEWTFICTDQACKLNESEINYLKKEITHIEYLRLHTIKLKNAGREHTE